MNGFHLIHQPHKILISILFEHSNFQESISKKIFYKKIYLKYIQFSQDLRSCRSKNRMLIFKYGELRHIQLSSFNFDLEYRNAVLDLITKNKIVTKNDNCFLWLLLFLIVKIICNAMWKNLQNKIFLTYLFKVFFHLLRMHA